MSGARGERRGAEGGRRRSCAIGWRRFCYVNVRVFWRIRQRNEDVLKRRYLIFRGTVRTFRSFSHPAPRSRETLRSQHTTANSLEEEHPVVHHRKRERTKWRVER